MSWAPRSYVGHVPTGLVAGMGYVGALPEATVTGLSASAHAELSDSGVVTSMSPQARLLNLVQVNSYSTAVNKQISDMSVSVLRSLSDTIGKVATNVLGDVASAIPFIGAALSLVFDVWQSEKQAAAQRSYMNAQSCQNFYAALAPQGSGSGHKIVPADLFAPYIGLSGSWTGGKPPNPVVNWKSPALYVDQDWDSSSHFSGTPGTRSAIGRQLMSVTESPSDLGPAGNWVDHQAYDMMVAAARSALKQPKLGVPLARREMLTKLRVAMQTAWRPPYGSPLLPLGRLPGTPLPYPGENVSDGGASLLPAYLDLVSQEIDAGRITQEMIAFFDTHAVVKPGGMPDHVEALGGASAKVGCSEATWDFLARWRSTIHPAYTQDVAEQAELEAQVRSVMADLGIAAPPSSSFDFISRPVLLSLLGAAAVFAGYSYFRPALALSLYRTGGGFARSGYSSAWRFGGKAVSSARNLGGKALSKVGM